MTLKRIAITLFVSLLVFVNGLGCGITAFADTSLPDGAVKGLPERLAALDDQGNPVNSATGEYFFHVEDMKFGETYTKDVQLINLREDASYQIYFYVQPLFKLGDIDLEKGCECVFYLDGKEFYRGDVNGNGNIDLKNNPFYCGYYAPGLSHTIRCEITWNDIQLTGEVAGGVDNGYRIYDKDGEHIIEGPNGEGHLHGEIEFKWLFYSAVTRKSDPVPKNPGGTTPTPGPGGESTPDGDSTPDNNDSTPPEGGETFFPPYTGFLMRDGKVWIAAMGVIAMMIVAMLVMIKKQDKKKKQNTGKDDTK